LVTGQGDVGGEDKRLYSGNCKRRRDFSSCAGTNGRRGESYKKKRKGAEEKVSGLSKKKGPRKRRKKREPANGNDNIMHLDGKRRNKILKRVLFRRAKPGPTAGKKEGR